MWWYILETQVMFSVRSMLGSNHTVIDFEYVLNTDVDALFMKPLNDCSLPKPQIIGVGPEKMRNGNLILVIKVNERNSFGIKV